MINTNEYITFLLSTGLTQKDFLLLFLIYKKEQKNIDKYKARFPNADHTMIGMESTMKLIDEDWLEVNNKRELVVTNKFTKHFVKARDEALLEELLDEYPPFYSKGEMQIPLVTVDIFQYSLKYNRKIKESILEHKEILKDLDYAKRIGLIRFGVAKFIDANMWKPIRKLRLKETNVSDENFDFDQFDEDF